MDERCRAFIAAYDEFREAEREYHALNAYVAPPHELVAERRDRYYATGRALDAAREALGAVPTVQEA